MILQCQVFKIINIPMLKTLVNSSLTSSKTVVTGASHIKNIARNHVNSSFPSTSPPGGLYLEGRFNGGFFALRVWEAYIWSGLYKKGLIFGILRYFE